MYYRRISDAVNHCSYMPRKMHENPFKRASKLPYFEYIQDHLKNTKTARSNWYSKNTSDCGLVHKVSRINTPNLPLKAYEDLKAKRIKTYREKYHPAVSIRTSLSNYRQEDNGLINLPLCRRLASRLIKRLDGSLPLSTFAAKFALPSPSSFSKHIEFVKNCFPPFFRILYFGERSDFQFLLNFYNWQ